MRGAKGPKCLHLDSPPPDTPNVPHDKPALLNGPIGLQSFFEGTHTQRVLGQAGAGVFTLLLCWNYARHDRLISYLLVHLILVGVAELAFCGKLGHARSADGIPKASLPALAVSQLWSGSVLAHDFGAASDIRFTLSAMVVQYAVAAGTMVKLGPVRRLARTALASLLMPGAIVAMLHGHWTIGVGTVFFMLVVAVVGTQQMHQFYTELANLRSAAARQAELDRHRANTDDLTQLHNRRGIHALFRSEPDAFGALLYVDLDGFKSVNDNAGHATGDEVLEVVAKRLTSLAPDNALVARMGGDEFVILLRAAETDRAMLTAVEIESAIARPFSLAATTWRIGASVGIGHFGDDRSFEEVLHLADKAMFARKNAGATTPKADAWPGRSRDGRDPATDQLGWAADQTMVPPRTPAHAPSTPAPLRR